MVYGIEVRTIPDIGLFYGQPIMDQIDNIDQYVLNLAEKMKETWRVAHDNITKAQKIQKQAYDKAVTRQPKDFRIGDQVYLRNTQRKVGVCPKFQSKYLGPFRIINVDSTNASIVPVDSSNNKEQLVHLNRLKLAQNDRKAIRKKSNNITLPNPTEHDEDLSTSDESLDSSHDSNSDSK